MAIHEGKWSEAETHLRRSLEIDPACQAHAFNLGLVLKARGRQRAAIASFYQAVQLSPTDVSAQEQLYGLLSKAVEPARLLALILGFSIALFGSSALGRVEWLAWVVGPVMGIAAYFAWERWWLTTLAGPIGDFYKRKRNWECREKARGLGSSVHQSASAVFVIWLCLAIIWIPLVIIRLASGDWRVPLGLLGITGLIWKILDWTSATLETEPDAQRNAVLAAAAPDLTEDTPDVPAPLVPLRVLALASKLQVDAVLGPPSTAVPILTQPELMPGEYREYLLAGRGVVLARFFCGRAVSFSVWTERGQAENSIAALQVFFGLDGTGLTTWRGTASEHAWAGVTEGLSFSRLWVGHKERVGGGGPAIPCFNAAEAVVQANSSKS